MYNKVLFKPFSSREDFIFNGSLFDQDAGQPINLSGTIGSGTFSSWIVRTGAVLTASTTTITIPSFPIGNQLSALSLTVPTSLAIIAGNPITISDPSGLNTMSGYVTSYVSSTGALVAQIGLTFQFELRRKTPQHASGAFIPFFGSNVGPLLQASLGNGILITDIGFYQIRIPEIQFRRLQGPFTYTASLTVTDSQDTRGVFTGDLPVFFGGVTQ